MCGIINQCSSTSEVEYKSFSQSNYIIRGYIMLKNIIISIVLLLPTISFTQTDEKFLINSNTETVKTLLTGYDNSKNNLNFTSTNLLDFDLFGRSDDIPPLSMKRILGETAVGLSLGYLFNDYFKKKSEGTGLGGGIIWGTIWSAAVLAGTSGSVYVIGNIGEETGNLYVTLLSSSLIGILAMGLGAEDNSLNDNDITNKFLIPGMTLGAVLGFNLTRCYDGDGGSGGFIYSLINVRNNNIKIGMPVICINRISNSNKYACTASLVNIKLN